MKRRKINKRGQQVNLSNLTPVVITFAVAILAASLLGGITQDVKGTQCSNTYFPGNDTCGFANGTAVDQGADFNSSGAGLTGLLNLSGQFSNIGTILAIVVIIGLLVGAFAVFRA
jgi:hypothetical protein